MKILIAGDWHSELHEEAVFNALRSLGHETLRFPWHQYFKPGTPLGWLRSPLLKAQNKYMLGPVMRGLNRDLLDRVAGDQPDILFVYRGSHIYPETLKAIRTISPRTIIAGYNNDDPFSPHYQKWMWRHFLACIPEYDIVFSYRITNLDDFRAAGAKRVELLRSWYVPERNYPTALTNDESARYGCDVMFAGHYEDDGRLEYLERVVESGWKLKLYGHDYGWHPALKRSRVLERFVPLSTVWGEEYNKALAGAKIALCFFSKLNRDTYTRRCFEIPATGTFMLSEHSEDLVGLFRPGVEADYFTSPNELLDKLDIYLKNDDLRHRVSAAGRARLLTDGHDVVSRMRHVLSCLTA